MLAPLSESLETGGPKGPKHAPVSGFAPPVNLLDFKLFTQGQPYEAFSQMRENAPVCWHPEEDEYEPGFWVLTRYDDIMEVSRKPQIFSSQKGGIQISWGRPEKRHPQLFRASVDNMINLDAPLHLELRREHMPFFTPAYIQELKKKVDAQVTVLLDRMAPLGECDLVETFSAELPLFTLSEILGIPEADRPKLVKWMHYLEVAADTQRAIEYGDRELTEADFKFYEEFMANVQEMFEYGRSLLLKRRDDPKEDLLSAIARAQLEGEYLGEEWLDGSWLLIVFAGNDTTRNSISGTMRLLTDNPQQKQMLLDDMSLLPGAVHEFIRMVSPVIHMRRTAKEDAEIRGQKIGAGEKVVLWYGAANRDPEMFENPNALDITRANANKHLAFGFGPHVCLGKNVANMQLEAAYKQILTRFPDMRATAEPQIAPNNFVLAIQKLPVAFTKESAKAR